MSSDFSRVRGSPSPAYVARVAAAFNNNGNGVRGDLGAVVRAILLDEEARSAPTAQFGKLREPVLRVAQWMRAFGIASASGKYAIDNQMRALGQRPLFAQSVFGYFRPGYVPPNTQLATAGVTAPEFQITDESTVIEWVNLAEAMAGRGIGWMPEGKREFRSNYADQAAYAAKGDWDGLVENLNLLLFAGRMSPTLKSDIIAAIGGVAGNATSQHLNRARVALFVAITSPEYLIER